MTRQTAGQLTSRRHRLVSVLGLPLTFLRKSPKTEKTLATARHDGPSHAVAEFQGFAGGVDLWGIRPKLRDSPEDFVPENRRQRNIPAPLDAMKVASPQRTRNHFNENFARAQRRDRDLADFEGFADTEKHRGDRRSLQFASPVASIAEPRLAKSSQAATKHAQVATAMIAHVTLKKDKNPSPEGSALLAIIKTA